MTAIRNWAGTYMYRAPVVEAGDVEEVQALVRRGGRVRAIGTRHSFTDLPDTTGTLVGLGRMVGEPFIDEASRTVRVSAAMRYGDLAAWLEQRGWALHNLGSLPHISVAGAIATGTHGSGTANGGLATSVRSLEYVSASGRLEHVTDADADLAGLVVGLGAYGVVVGVGLGIQPTFRVRQDVYRGMSWGAALADFEGVMGSAYSVSIFTRWAGDHIGDVWAKSVATPDDAVPATWLDAPLDTEGVPEEGNLTPRGVLGPWHERLPHFRLDATPSHGDEIQSEYFVDLADAAAALSEVRALAASIEPLLLVSELRTVAADDLWLSGSYQRRTLAVHFTWRNDPHAVRAVLPAVEAALAQFAARPHWGKLHLLGGAELSRVVPRLADARALFRRLDPDGVFSNAHLERVGVRDPAPAQRRGSRMEP